MWSFYKPKKRSYNLRKGPFLNLPRIQSTYCRTTVIHVRGSYMEQSSKLNPAIQFSNLKPKLKIWEILIVDV